MRSRGAARRGCCVLVGLWAAFLAACADSTSTGAVSNTPTPLPVVVTPTGLLGVPPSVAAFCPSPQALAPIVGETMSPDLTTGRFGATTTCGYEGPSGDLCGFTLTAWADARVAGNDYTIKLNAVEQIGGQQVQVVTGLGDAAFYWVDEDITVLKGSYDFTGTCYFIVPKRPEAYEQVDVQIAQLLVSRI